MTPAKRRPATPASQGAARTAPDVPKAANPPSDAPAPDERSTAPAPPEETNDGTQLLGPDGEPIAEDAPAGDASGDSAPPNAGPVDAGDRATTPSPRRPLSLYPLPVWPD